MHLRIGDPMPEEVQVLPTPEQLERAIGAHDKDPTAVFRWRILLPMGEVHG